MNYTETTDTNQQWENIKYAITTAAKETLRKLQQQPRKPHTHKRQAMFV